MWAIAASARELTELNPIAKNRDSLPTNGDSLQRLLVASERQMLYNGFKFHKAKSVTTNVCARSF
jgi:hypothetical protein